MGDHYASMEALFRREREGRDFKVVFRNRGSRVTVVAPHGGRIEPHTDVVARALAAEDLNLFVFTGIKRRRNRRLHVTSTRFTHPDLELLLRHSRIAVSVHGRRGAHPRVAVGGGNVQLRKLVLASLRLSGFEAREDTSPSSSARSPSNFVNRPRDQGVQLELAPRLRKRLGADPAYLAAFCAAVRTALHGGQGE